MSVSPIPDGYASVTPYLIISGAKAAIEFYKTVFGATERLCLPGPDGRVAHAELEIGDSVIMLADECPERGAKSPQTYGGSPVSIHLYVNNSDQVYAKALAAGAKSIRPVRTSFMGTVQVGLPIRSAISGMWPHMWRMCHQRNCNGGWRRCGVREAEKIC